MTKKLLLSLILCVATMLTGCVGYDVGINFNNPHNGAIVQHITIGQQLANLSESESRKWLKSIEKRSHKLHGKVEKINSQELIVTIPFNNGTELVNKFNQLFHNEDYDNYSDIPEEAQLDSQVALKQSNLILYERNSLDLTIDLRALESLSHQEKVIVTPESLANLEFHLNTSSWANSISRKDNIKATKTDAGLIWKLQPGQINHIQAVFWLPSPIGIGAAGIILLMILGFLIKYRRFPGLAVSE